MSESPDWPIRRFNPGLLQSDDALRDLFVVRHQKLEDVLTCFDTNVVTPSRHNILIVGDRGQGKTMLLARVAADLRTDPRNRHFLPVRFMEENHEIATTADFWLEALFYLAREIGHDTAQQLGGERERLIRHDTAQQLDRERERLAADWRAERVAADAYATVLAAATQLKRRLVLMVENLQVLLRQIDDEFLTTLTRASELTLIATSPLSLEDPPLKDLSPDIFGKSIYLEPLNEVECRALWNHITGAEISAEGEIEPIRVLTGGNARLLTMIASLRAPIGSSVKNFIAFLDDHTEYFRGRIRDLPPGERRVYLAMADGDTLTVPGDIAARARMDIRVTSTMLGRLVARGMIKHEDEASTQKREYRLTESVVALYYRVRRTRDAGAILACLLRIMPGIYPEKTWDEITEEIVQKELPELVLSAGLSPKQAELIHDTLSNRENIGEVPDELWMLETAGGRPTWPVDVGASENVPAKAVALLEKAATCDTAEGRKVIYERIIEQYERTPEAHTVVAKAFSAQLHWARDDADCERIARTILERFVTDRTEHELVAKWIEEGQVRGLLTNSEGRIIELYGAISVVPDAIGALTNLESLKISITGRPGGIPHTIGRLGKLRRLEVWGGKVDAGGRRGLLPDSVGELKKLESLKIMAYRSGQMPNTVGNLAALVRLVVYGQSGEIPDAIGNLRELEVLLVSGEVKRVPGSIGRLRNLRSLTLRGRFVEVPETIGGLTKLRALRMRGDFKRMPTTVTNLEKLRRLEIGRCVSRIPAGIARLKELRELSVWGTFRVIPKGVGALSRLRMLEAVGGFTIVPESIGELAELEKLRLLGSESASVQPLPGALTRLGKLKYLWATAPHAGHAAGMETWLKTVNHSTRTSRLERWQSLYEEVLVRGADNPESLLALVVKEAVEFIGVDGGESEILEILSRDRERAVALLPLEVALKRRLGIRVAVPAEVEEVAAEIRKRMEGDRFRVAVGRRRAWGLLLSEDDFVPGEWR